MRSRPPRDYQLMARNETVKAVSQGFRKGYFTLPTGTGKTRCLTLLAEHFATLGRILFISHRQEIVYQIRDAVEHDTDLKIGIIMGGQKDFSADVISATIQSMTATNTAAWLGDAGPWAKRDVSAIFIDECHHCVPKSTYERFIQQVEAMYPNVAVIGTTATPYRGDKSRMQEVLPECFFSRTIPEMQAAGWLCPLEWRSLSLPIDLSSVGTSTQEGEKDYKPDELYDLLSPQTQYIAKTLAPQIKDKPVLIFAVNVQHAIDLAAAFRFHGVQVDPLSGTTPKDIRTNTLALWKSGQLQGVSNCALFTEGFDYTPTGNNSEGLVALIIACPTLSASKYLQMLGRVLRIKPHEAKYQSAYCIDIAGNANLLDTKQVSLPKLLPTQYGLDLVRDEAGLSEPILIDGVQDDTEEPDGAVLPAVCKEIGIRDPFATSYASWGYHPTTGVYYLSLGRTEDIQPYAVMLRNETTGLYHGYIIKEKTVMEEWSRKTIWSRAAITLRGKPLGEMMHHFNHVIAQNGIKHLVDKNAKWRSDMASHAQIKFLQSLDSYAAQQARLNQWSKGQVGHAINWAKIRPFVYRLQKEVQYGGHTPQPVEAD